MFTRGAEVKRKPLIARGGKRTFPYNKSSKQAIHVLERSCIQRPSNKHEEEGRAKRPIIVSLAKKKAAEPAEYRSGGREHLSPNKRVEEDATTKISTEGQNRLPAKKDYLREKGLVR